jgi:GNAT superfamily N-acetyltransferase
VIRAATPADLPSIYALVKELAVYERALDAVEATEKMFGAVLFGADPKVFCHVACDDESGEVVGMALWFLSFSTWLGRHGIYLEDLVVREDQRGTGHGLALLKTLARICVERGYGRLEWSVLDWNEPALRFYRSIGAVPMDEWTVQRLDAEGIARLAGA